METNLTEKEIRKHLGDRNWRINNLYFVKDENGNKVLFKLNDVQKELHKNLWFFTIVPKARQLGVCLDPKTKVLTADLKWVEIGSIKVGEKIISVDEFPLEKRKGVTRKMRTGEVEGVVRLKRETYKIKFSDGRELICTGKHPWLSRKTNTQASWMTIDGSGQDNRKNKLTVGSKIRWMIKPWGDSTVEDCWFGGILDGEGSCSKSSRPGVNIGVSQVAGGVLDRMIKYCKDSGYKYRIEKDNRKAGVSSKLGDKVVYKIVFSRMSDVFRLLGQTRPTRFIGNKFWEGKEMPSMKEDFITENCWAEITSIEPLGMNEVIDLQTSVGTYIAEGFVSHNTTFFAILYFDQILFSQNKTAGIIAHRQEDMKKIFKSKIRFAWDNLHPWLKRYIGNPETDSAYELSFPNGSNIFVSMNTRSGTVQFLHVSEFGYICQKFPEKADEIVSGAINSVHPGNMVSIESTSAGREGHFYSFCMEADKVKKQGKELSELDFKLFFFPWYIDDRYTLKGNFLIEQEMKDYFQSLEQKQGIKLSDGQKRWYVKKKKLNGEKMFSEYPSTLDEAFQTSIDGAYYVKEMAKVYRDNRIRPIAHDPLVKVDTWWDLGMNDFNVILLTQTKGSVINFINMYWNSGESLAHYYNWLEEQRDKLNYRYGTNNFPHDVKVRELGTGHSRKETLYKLGMTNIRVGPNPRDISISDGINSVRIVFPRFIFDEEKCRKLHESLFNYRKEFDKKLGVFRDTPRHDESSHFTDAVRLLAILWREEFIEIEGAENHGDQSFFS